MRTINSNRMKRIVVSALTITSVMAPLTAVEGAALTISAIIQEQVGYRPDCASQFGGTITGTGTSSLPGRISIEANDCITPVENHLSFEGTMIFTLSSGDEIFADYFGSFIPTNYPSLFTFKDSFFNITGGTGNFLSATGGGKLEGGENISTGWGVIQATGTISNFTKGKQGKHSSQPSSSHQRSAESMVNSAFFDTGGSSGVTMIDLPDNSFHNTHTLGDFFYQNQNGQLLAINELPESGSLSLLGIGLVTLAAVRRRKLQRSR